MIIGDFKISSAITPTAGAAGITDITGTIVSMQNFRNILMVVTFGAITAGAVTSIKAQQDIDPAGGTMADLAGTGQTIADTDDDKTFYIDIQKPGKPYLRLFVDRATQNAAVANAFYIQYNARSVPVAQGTNVGGEVHFSPAEGTA